SGFPYCIGWIFLQIQYHVTCRFQPMRVESRAVDQFRRVCRDREERIPLREDRQKLLEPVAADGSIQDASVEFGAGKRNQTFEITRPLLPQRAYDYRLTAVADEVVPRPRCTTAFQKFLPANAVEECSIPRPVVEVLP